ncbi:MAG: IS4 family transposase [Leptolyngbyaceae cyanobacterium SM1_4_3]|nr:IS4 family transposase [Leptolyngbyaceae cyanobacterium SM1_4_3]
MNKKLPSSYQTYLEQYLNPVQVILVTVLINLLQEHRWVRLEQLANRFPLPITFEGRRRRLQRFLSCPSLSFKSLWLPLIQRWIEINFDTSQVLYFVIDRTQWGGINLLVLSLVYQNRALPIYCELLPQLGSTSLLTQTAFLEQVLPRFSGYPKVILGDREFCGVELARWLSSYARTWFCLRLRCSTYLEIQTHIEQWIQLSQLGLTPGTSLYFQGIKITKSKGFGPVNLAANFKKTYGGKRVQEPWFICTNFSDFHPAISAYQRRMGIEEMFRDFKKGGYNLEPTRLQGQRLLALILLICFAYCASTFVGIEIKRKGVAKYINRPSERRRSHRRHSSFYTGLHTHSWLESLDTFAVEMAHLTRACPSKRLYYQQGFRTASLALSAF